MNKPNVRENKRLALQRHLDDAKTQEERNKLGQFATPPALARDIIVYSSNLLSPQARITFLDPAIGTGAFYSAFREIIGENRIARAAGYEVDSHYGLPARKLWRGTALKIVLDDFTKAEPPTKKEERFNLIVCNPPYVRHHHLCTADKVYLRDAAKRYCGIEINGLVGFYCYFLCLSHRWMTDCGLGVWLIPSEFMDVNYGAGLKRYLLEKVTLLRIHRFDAREVQFEDAMVSSAILCFRKEVPPVNHEINFTLGGTLLEPKISVSVKSEGLKAEEKWSRLFRKESRASENGVTLSDYFTIKRGIATGGNGFFIIPRDKIEEFKLPWECFCPVLPSPRFLDEDEVKSDANGNPLVNKELFLLRCRLPEEKLRLAYPCLHRYLMSGRAEVAKRYLCRHRRPWYGQEVWHPAPFLCTYMGRTGTKRGRPFRFILNNSNATATNVYLLLYPKKNLRRAIGQGRGLIRKVWKILNALQPEDLLENGRFYGGGLHKLEPRELGRVPAPELLTVTPVSLKATGKQMCLF